MRVDSPGVGPIDDCVGREVLQHPFDVSIVVRLNRAAHNLDVLLRHHLLRQSGGFQGLRSRSEPQADSDDRPVAELVGVELVHVDGHLILMYPIRPGRASVGQGEKALLVLVTLCFVVVPATADPLPRKKSSGWVIAGLLNAGCCCHLYSGRRRPLVGDALHCRKRLDERGGGHHLYWEIGFRTQAVILKENVPGTERSVVHRTDSEGFALPK